MRRMARLSAALLLGASLGCIRVPPKTVAQDRFDYGQAIADSWKRQTLINVVRLRYLDSPTFMEVSSVINSYSISGSVSAGASIPETPGTNDLSLGGSRSWSNSPTVSYQPLTGQKFSASLLHTIPPASMFQMIQAGYPVTLIFRTVLSSINGLSNQSFGKRADPRFDRLVAAMERIQRSGAMSIRVEERKEGESVVMVLTSETIEDVIKDDLRTVRELLGLQEGSPEYSIGSGSIPRNNLEIAVQTRSMLAIILELSFGVEVAPSDLTDGRAMPGKAAAGEACADPLIRIRSGESARPTRSWRCPIEAASSGSRIRTCPPKVGSPS